MTISSSLWLLLAVASTQAGDPSDSKSGDSMLCGPATEIFLPDPQRQVAPNVRLEHLQFMSPGDPCGRNFNHDEVTLLHNQLAAIAASSLSTSNAAFSIMVQYTLTSGSPATLEMRVMDAPDSEKARLTDFYNAAKVLEGFHPSTGIVHVAIQYKIVSASTPTGGG
ncbi:MAG: hypothetical protein EOP13_20595 [Pseudomonas sp.]|uniref:hypothetical protein n=1 Tax=Pseudomonas sp. TaxID=306 RepID=UPI001221A4C5|nr:hypothetical protein [Pseudomonas sp.]RZI70586.1 MAG: hypothetical protein EOP13_20595 [Pseudomonas sp.]